MWSRQFSGSIIRSLGLCLLFLSSATHAADKIDSDGWRVACHELIMQYAYYRDRPDADADADADAVAALFTTDAIFILNDARFEGREAIRERVAAGADGLVFRHLMSTIHLERTGSRTARGVSYVTVFAAPGTPPIEQSDFLAIGEYHDDFVLTKAGWRIAHRSFKGVFTPGD